jgi:hypothetical protein
MGSGSGEFDLSEFQLGTSPTDRGRSPGDLSSPGTGEQDVLLDDLTVPGDLVSGSSSSSTILGLGSGGKRPSDSDVRLVPDNVKGASDSDVRVAPVVSKKPSDSDVTLVNDDPSFADFPAAKPDDTAVRKSPMLGSSAEVPSAGSDFDLSPSGMINALQPESGSDFELTALDASDEFESTPLVGPGDSDVTAAGPAASGINLSKPSDSGINLGGPGGFDLDVESIELAPLDDEQDTPKRPAAAPAKPSPSLSATPIPSAAKGEKDIFDDTDFEVDALDSDNDDRTMQLQAGGSDFELEESDSASEIFAIDEDDVDENAATSMSSALSDEDDASEEFDAGEMTSGWDVENEGMGAAAAAAASSAPAAMISRGDSAEWGGLWVGFLAVSSVLVLLLAFVSIDLMRNLYDFRGSSNPVSSGLVKTLGGLLPK